MEKIGQNMPHMNRVRQFDYQELVKQIMADPDVAAFIQQEKLTQAEIQRSVSKFNQYITERNRFLLGDETYIAKGYKPILVKNEGYADVAYEETPELIEQERQEAIRSRLNLISLPASLKEASLAQVDLDDVGRYKAFELLTNFVADFPHYQKAVYLYGDFGVGKSYMMAALAHDLSEKRKTIWWKPIFKYFQEVAILIFALILNPSMTICPLLHWLSCDTDFIDDFRHLPFSAQQNYPVWLSTYIKNSKFQKVVWNAR